jgi:hypothetical protein
MLLVDGAIAAAVVRGDPTMARAAREAARVLLTAAGVDAAGAATAKRRASTPGPRRKPGARGAARSGKPG